MNRFIIADASKCIGCRTCEVACVVSHQEHQDCASPDASHLSAAYSRDQRGQCFHGDRLPSV